MEQSRLSKQKNHDRMRAMIAANQAVSPAAQEPEPTSTQPSRGSEEPDDARAQRNVAAAIAGIARRRA